MIAFLLLMVNKLKILLSVVAFALASTCVASEKSLSPSDNARVVTRLEEANRSFERFLGRAPSTEIAVLAHLRESINSSELNSLMSRSGALVQGFRFGNSKFAGGYKFPSGVPVEVALSQFREEYSASLERMVSTSRSDVIFWERRADQRSAEIARRDVEKMQGVLDDFIRSGPEIIGLDLLGKVSDIDALRARTPVIRALEITTKPGATPAIFPFNGT